MEITFEVDGKCQRGGVIPDTVALMTLKALLDRASATLLEDKLDRNENLAYYDFWDELKARFTRDGRTTNRQAWEMVRLHKVGFTPTLQEWNEYQAAYVKKRALVEDWSDAEDRKFVFKQVPEKYQKRIINETSTVRAKQYWMRVSVPPEITPQEVLETLED